MTTDLARQRFVATLRIVQRESVHLDYSRRKLEAMVLTAEKLEKLDQDPEVAEAIEAFASRFGRMQDTMAAKLFPRFLEAQAERAGTQLETLNRLEKLGLIESVERWLEARALRNRLIHEYVENMEKFKRDLDLAQSYTLMFVASHQRILEYGRQSLQLSESEISDNQGS